MSEFYPGQWLCHDPGSIDYFSNKSENIHGYRCTIKDLVEPMADYRILLAIDLKDGTDRLLKEAERHAKAHNATVDILHVAPLDPAFIGYIKGGEQIDSEREHHAKVLRAEHQQTEKIANELRASGVRVDRALMVQSGILDAILEHVQKIGTDLLILGSHHHGALFRAFYGDIAIEAAKKPPCALLIIPV